MQLHFSYITSRGATHNRNPNTDCKRGKCYASIVRASTTYMRSDKRLYQRQLDIVKKGNLCYNCFAHHKVSQCTSRFHCKKCKKKHHTSLHSGEIHKPIERKSNNQKGKDPPASVIHTTLTQASHAMLR